MRLTCPNCDAQYEVDDRAIPEGGRDVQCSNCGHAWFQLPAHVEEATEDEAVTFGDRAPAAEPLPASPPIPRQPPPPDVVAPEPPPASPRMEPRRQVLDETVQAVLREEAERERRARDSERGAIETQPDLGLVTPGRAAPRAAARPLEPQATRDRAAAPPGPEDDDDEAEQPASPRGARRGLLPDIEQINSTLRATTERDRATPPTPTEMAAEQRRGFRLGFRTVILIVLVLVVIYILAPTIEAKVPTLAPVLEALVAGMDGIRTLLDRLFTSAVAMLHGRG